MATSREQSEGTLGAIDTTPVGTSRESNGWARKAGLWQPGQACLSAEGATAQVPRSHHQVEWEPSVARECQFFSFLEKSQNYVFLCKNLLTLKCSKYFFLI